MGQATSSPSVSLCLAFLLLLLLLSFSLATQNRPDGSEGSRQQVRHGIWAACLILIPAEKWIGEGKLQRPREGKKKKA